MEVDVQIKFPILDVGVVRDSDVLTTAVYRMKNKSENINIFNQKSNKDSPSARWGLRPQAPFRVLAKFGDKNDLVIGKIRTLCHTRKFPGGGCNFTRG
ncbi:hypothetical protein J6590_083481 [Homalodisca vitripennis]|nr:hypothetical protein J6590_083481 [Homalodisca vitripennis]